MTLYPPVLQETTSQLVTLMTSWSASWQNRNMTGKLRTVLNPRYLCILEKTSLLSDISDMKKIVKVINVGQRGCFARVWFTIIVIVSVVYRPPSGHTLQDDSWLRPVDSRQTNFLCSHRVVVIITLYMHLVPCTADRTSLVSQLDRAAKDQNNNVHRTSQQLGLATAEVQ